METEGFWTKFGPHILTGTVCAVGVGLLAYVVGYGREMRKTGSFETNNRGFDIRWTPEEEWWEPKAKSSRDNDD